MELPLFPLHLVLFPGRPLQLHVFEQRYREMLRHCLDGDRRLGVVAIRSGSEVGCPADIFSVGTVAEIEAVQQLPDGRANIGLRGKERFRVDRLLSGTSYLRARVLPLEEVPPNGSDDRRARALRNLLVPYLACLGAPQELLERLPQRAADLAWLAAGALQVDLPEQQRLLELGSCRQRLEESLQMLRREAGLIRHFGTVGSLRPPAPCGADLN